MSGFSSPGIYTADPQGRYRFAADKDRAEAKLLDIVAGVLLDARTFEQAARELFTAADNKRHSASLLDGMAEEQKNASEGEVRRG